MTRIIRTGYWHIPEPASTRGGQHVGTPNGVLVYDEDLQLGILSFSERSQIKNVAEANALLDLAAEVKPGARRAADLSAEDVEALRWAIAELTDSEFVTSEKSRRFVALLDRIASSGGSK